MVRAAPRRGRRTFSVAQQRDAIAIAISASSGPAAQPGAAGRRPSSAPAPAAPEMIAIPKRCGGALGDETCSGIGACGGRCVLLERCTRDHASLNASHGSSPSRGTEYATGGLLPVRARRGGLKAIIVVRRPNNAISHPCAPRSTPHPAVSRIAGRSSATRPPEYAEAKGPGLSSAMVASPLITAGRPSGNGDKGSDDAGRQEEDDARGDCRSTDVRASRRTARVKPWLRRQLFLALCAQATRTWRSRSSRQACASIAG